jgi:hypothetical protein
VLGLLIREAIATHFARTVKVGLQLPVLLAGSSAESRRMVPVFADQ